MLMLNNRDPKESKEIFFFLHSMPNTRHHDPRYSNKFHEYQTQWKAMKIR